MLVQFYTRRERSLLEQADLSCPEQAYQDPLTLTRPLDGRMVNRAARLGPADVYLTDMEMFHMERDRLILDNRVVTGTVCHRAGK